MELPDNLKHWIAKNVLDNRAEGALREALISMGYDANLVDAEIYTAKTHPYTQLARELTLKMDKYASMLKTLDSMKRLTGKNGDLKIRKFPSYDKFLKEYYYENRFGRLKGAIDHWPALKKWNLDYLTSVIGADTEVEIQRGRTTNPKYEENMMSLRSKISFGEYINMVKTIESNDFYLTANNYLLKNEKAQKLWDDIGNLGDGYLDTNLFTANAQAVHLWVGPKGSITPVHYDANNNFFVQVYGKKRLRIVPMVQTPYMYNNNAVYSDIDMLNPDLLRYPDYNKLQIFEFDTKPGDVVFIPVGWWHHVEGLTPNISLSITCMKDAVNNTFTEYPGMKR